MMLRIMSMMKEQECIKQILDGHTEEYRALVDRYQTGLIIHCENILKDREDGEDIAQEAFIKAYKNIHAYADSKAKFSTWLYRIATNLCIDLLRRNKRKVHLKDIESNLETVQPDHIEDEQIQHIRSAVMTLEPPKYAALIKAYFWEGRSYQELADSYNTSTNTIGTWMRRAKSQLKEKLS